MTIRTKKGINLRLGEVKASGEAYKRPQEPLIV